MDLSKYKNLFEMKEVCYRKLEKLVTSGQECLKEMERLSQDEALLKRLSEQLEEIKKTMHMLVSEEHDDYYFAVASLAALRSKDPSTPVGACVVDSSKRIVGIGYNSMPHSKEKNNDKKYLWEKSMCGSYEQGSSKKYSCEKTKYPFVCHAALNAIASRVVPSLEGCAIYLTIHPDEDCAHLIVQSGIKDVMYSEASLSDEYKGSNECYPPFQNAKYILQSSGIRLKKYMPKIIPQLSVTKTNQKSENDTNPCRKRDIPELSLETRKMKRSEELDHGFVVSWDELFISLAMLEKAFTNPKDKAPKKKQGTCIVSPDNQILAIGGSMVSPGIDYSEMQPIGGSIDGDPFVCHAEFQTITAYRGTVPLKGCKLYVTLSPCNVCAKLIVQSGIKEVIYKEPINTPNVKESFFELSKTIFDNSGIDQRQLNSVQKLKLSYQEDRPSYLNVFASPKFSQYFTINVRCTEGNSGVLADESSLYITPKSIFKASSIGEDLYRRIQLHSLNVYFNSCAVDRVHETKIFSIKKDQPVFSKEMSPDFRDLAQRRSGKVVRLNWKWWTDEKYSSDEADCKVCLILLETRIIIYEALDLKVDFKVTFLMDEDDDHE